MVMRLAQMVGPDGRLKIIDFIDFSWAKIRNLPVSFRVVPLSTSSSPISLAYKRPRKVLN